MNITLFYERFLNYFEGLRDQGSDVFDGFTFEYLLREAYTSIFEIVDLEDREEPLGMVRYTNADTQGDIGPIAEVIQSYRSNEILDKYGLSITDYFNMPVNIAKLLVSNANTEKQDTKDILQAAKTSADNEWKRKK